MDKEEFKKTRALLGLTQDEMADKLQVSRRTIINMENGTKDVPFLVAKYLKELLLEISDQIFMDVSNTENLSLASMIKFCFEDENREAFLNSDQMKLLIENIKIRERNNIYEKHIILKNQDDPV